jgi:hypothetical protein
MIRGNGAAMKTLGGRKPNSHGISRPRPSPPIPPHGDVLVAGHSKPPIDGIPACQRVFGMFEFLVSLDWSKIVGVVSSVTSLVTMSIALIALGSWKRTLRNQRIDECISAAYDLRGEIGDWVTIIHQARSSSIDGLAQGPVFTEAFDHMLRSLRVCPETSGWIAEFSEHEAD